MILDGNISQTARVSVMPLDMSPGGGSATTSTNAVAQVKLPYGARVKRLDVAYSGATGTSPSLTVTLVGSVTGTIATSPALTTTGSTYNKTQADVRVQRDETLQINTTLAGTSPNFANVCITVWLELCDLRDVEGAAGDVQF